MNVVEVECIDGMYNIYYSNGEIGRSFYSKDRTCQNVSDDPEQFFVCSECGCELVLYTEEWDRDDVWEEPNYYVDGEERYPNYCPNCGAFIIGKRPEV